MGNFIYVCFSRAKDLVLSIVNQRSKTEVLGGGPGEMNLGIGGAGSAGIAGGNGSSGGPPTSSPAPMMGHPGFVEIMIPGPKVGLIIGKGGETIKHLQEKSGAKMVVIQEGPSQEQEKPLRFVYIFFIFRFSRCLFILDCVFD